MPYRLKNGAGWENNGKLLKDSWKQAADPSGCDCAGMLEVLGILLSVQDFRAGMLEKGDCAMDGGQSPVRPVLKPLRRMSRASYILEPEQPDGPAACFQRPGRIFPIVCRITLYYLSFIRQPPTP